MMRGSFAVLFVCLVGQQSYAHRLIVEAKPSPGSVKIEAYYFEDDTPAQNARVTLLKNDMVIQTGLTDDRGVCTLPVNETGEILVKVESVGHAAKTTFTAIAMPNPVASETIEEPPAPSPSFEVLDLPTWLRVTIGLFVITLISTIGYFVLRLRTR